MKNKKKNKIKGVYMLYFKNNDKVYIGSSVDIKNRVSTHKSMLKCFCHSNSLLQRDYNVYGEDNLCWKVLEEFREDEDIGILLKKESEYILKYKAHIYGYNKTCITSNRILTKHNFVTEGEIYTREDLTDIIYKFFKQHDIKFRLIKNKSLNKIKGYEIESTKKRSALKMTEKELASLFRCFTSEVTNTKNMLLKNSVLLLSTYVTNMSLRKRINNFSTSHKINKPLSKLYTNNYRQPIKDIFVIDLFNPYTLEHPYVRNFIWEFKLFRICRELEEGRYGDKITITLLDKEMLQAFKRIQEEFTSIDI